MNILQLLFQQFGVGRHRQHFGIFLGFVQYLNLKDLCLFGIKLLQNLLWMFKNLREWTKNDCKPRFSANYLRQVQMDHILLYFFFTVFFTKCHQCLHKNYCALVFLALVILHRCELVMLLDVSEPTFETFRWLIRSVHHLYYFFALAT